MQQQHSDPKSIIIALALATGIIFLFQTFFAVPQQADTPLKSKTVQTINNELLPETAKELLTNEEALAQNPRVKINTPSISGSLSLKGATIDDIQLNRHRTQVEKDSPAVTLLAPQSTLLAQYARFGWMSKQAEINLPDENTVWQTDNAELTIDSPVTLTWNNNQGLIFTIKLAVTDDYLINVVQQVTNNSGQNVAVYPYSSLYRSGEPEGRGIVYRGAMLGSSEKLQEISYKKLRKQKSIPFTETGGWIGFGEHYWLTALLPPQQQTVRYRGQQLTTNSLEPLYQLEYVVEVPLLGAGKTQSVQQGLFAGAKNAGLIDNYQEKYNLPNFDRAIDYGWFYFIAKPISQLLHWLYLLVGNYGWAIVLLTLIIRGLMLPFTYKSYKSMAQLKEIQPKMLELQEKYSDDRMKLSQEMMGLYKKEKVNPMSGCLPILIQLPIFFALYKTLLISLEMRHTEFGWIRDLAAPDPLYILNGFGALDIPLPEFLQIGIWPALVAITMYVSQRMNPQPTDKTQALMFNLFPVVFLFISAYMPAGLCVYWTVSNLCTILQQQFIRKRMDKRVSIKTSS